MADRLAAHGLRRRHLLRLLLGAAGAGALAPLLRTARVAAQTDTTDIGQWSMRTPMPVGRSEVGVAELDGKVYVVGGYASGNVDQPLNQVYDPISDGWQTLAPLPRGLNHVAVVGFDHQLYAFGG